MIFILCMQVVARLGIAVTGSIGYKLEPEAQGQVCASCSSLGARACYTVHQSWPNSAFEVYPYYQLRTFTGGFGRENQFSSVAVERQFGSRARQLLAQDCGGPNEAVCDVTEPPTIITTQPITPSSDTPSSDMPSSITPSSDMPSSITPSSDMPSSSAPIFCRHLQEAHGDDCIQWHTGIHTAQAGRIH